MIDTGRIDELVAGVLPTVVELRRALHRRPELAGEEYQTTELVVDTLRQAHLNPRPRTPRTGLTVEVGTVGHVVGYRADLDALPITEPPGLEFASELPGLMHACGHDAHTAVAVGVALVLAGCEESLRGRARIIFQPSEEAFPGGAYELVRDGVLSGVSSIVALHVDPGLETGKIGLRAGAITSAADRLFITLEGPGGHTARPHQTVDLVHAAGVVITQAPALLGRLVDPRVPMTLVFGRVQGGTADNVIPTHVELSGTIRGGDPAVWDEIPGLVERLVHDLVAPLGAKAIVHYQRGIPPVINDAGVVSRIGRVAAETLGEQAITAAQLSLGAEDFARYLEEVPGALVRLGCRVGARRVDLHSSEFMLDEGCLEVGVRLAVAIVLDLMRG